MNVGEYLLGLAALAAVAGSLAVGAWTLRRRFLPGWNGPPARLAEAVLALSGFVVACELLGAVGAFRALPLVLATAALGGAAWFYDRRRGPPPRGPELPAPRAGLTEVGLAAFATALTVLPWLGNTRLALSVGMTREMDTLWYHMPFAARFADTGWVTHLHGVGDASPSFLPATSELFHAAGIVAFGSDVLSPLLGLGWLALALLAGWCIGRPAGVSPGTLTATALVVSLPIMINTQPGSAKNDVVGLAFLLASVALFVNGREERPALAIAGLAAGLAVGTRLNALGPVLALTAGVVVLAERRREAAVAWGLGLLATGSFWYVRNLFAAANPLPWVGAKIGPLTLPSVRPPRDCGNTTLLHFADRLGTARHELLPQVHGVLGAAWPALLAVVGAGVLAGALVRRDRTTTMLALVALAATISYLVTPAAGTVACFAGNTRFAVLALGLGATLLPLALARTGLPRVWVVAPLAVLLAVDAPHGPLRVVGALAFAAAVVLVVIAARRRVLPRRLPALGLALATLIVLVAGWPVQMRYLEDRYARGGLPEPIGPSYLALRDVKGAHIAAGGFIGHYPLYGRRPENTVDIPVVAESHGDFRPIRSCREWVRALERGRYDYVVTAPAEDGTPPPEEAWTRADPRARQILRAGRNTVFRLDRGARGGLRPWLELRSARAPVPQLTRSRWRC
jgi:hypothetical protein